MSEHGGIGAMASGEAYGLGWQPTIGGTNGTDRRSSDTGGGDGSGHNLVAVAQTKEKRGRNLSGQTTPQRQPSLHEENSTSTNPEQAQAGCARRSLPLRSLNHNRGGSGTINLARRP